MTSPEEPEEEKITEQELEDYLAQLSEETERERERYAAQVDGEADRYNEMTDEEFEKEAARQGTTPFKLAKRGVHDGMKNFRHHMRQMEIAREIMKRRLKEQPELAQDPEFKADMQFLEKEIPEHKKDLKVMKEEMRKL